MHMRFEAEELDRDTLDYLRGVVRHEGHGMPGIYLNAKEAGLWVNGWLIAALLCGPIVLMLTMAGSVGSVSDPVAIALYLTAGFFLGGWMLTACVRCVIARRRDDYLGYFKYVDPLYLWHSDGRGVWVTPIDMLLHVELHHNYERDIYTSSMLRLELAERKVMLPVHSESKAEELETFFQALLDIRQGSPAERGYQALERIEEDEERQITTIPEPRRVRTSLGWVRYPVLISVAVMLFFVCRPLAGYLRDDAIYQAVKGKQPPELRIYLADPRNTRYREQVVAELSRFHEAAALKLEKQGDPALGHGLADLVRGLTSEARPVLTFTFVPPEDKAGDPEKYLSSAVLQTLNVQIGKELAALLTQQIGPGMVDVAEVMEGPGMIELKPRVVRQELGRVNHLVLEWTVTLQADAQAKKHICRMRQQTTVDGNDYARALRRLYPQFSTVFRTHLTIRPPG